MLLDQNKVKRYFKSNIVAILLVIAFFFVYSINLGRDYLTDWDECVIVQQAKEMKKSGNLLTNFWNGEPLLEKPPLNAVLTQIPFLFGINEFNARIFIALYGAILSYLIYIFADKYVNRVVGIISILLFFGNNMFSVYMRHVNTDIGFTLFSFGAFLLWVIFLNKKDNLVIKVVLSGILCGLAVLIKGLSITPYLVSFFIIGLIIKREKSIIPFCILLCSFLVTILPWHLYQFIKYKNEFLYVYFYEHLWKRSRFPVDFHFEGRLFYIKKIIEYFRHLLLFIFIPIILSIKNLYKIFISDKLKTNFLVRLNKFVEENQLLIVIMIMVLLPLFMLVNVRTRILWYIMPVFPFIILLISFSIYKLIELFNNKGIKRFLLIFILLILIYESFIQIKLNVNPFSKEISYNEKERYDVFLKAKDLKINKIKYLVWEPERVAEAILPSESRLSTTFRFGGNPCAVYYSDKKILYEYSLEEFIKNLRKDDYFVMYKDDFEKLKDVNKVKIYSNINFGIFKVL